MVANILKIDPYIISCEKFKFEDDYRIVPTKIVISHETFDYLALKLDAVSVDSNGKDMLFGMYIEIQGSLGFGEFYLK